MNQAHINLVQAMQDYLIAHAEDEPFDFDAFYAMTGYSRRHADRIFKTYLHMTPRNYVLRLRLTESARSLLQSNTAVVDEAMRHYESHEGYTKAFSEAFGISPSRYRKGKSFIPLFIPYSIRGSYEIAARKETTMEKQNNLCMIIPVERPGRKLIFMPSKSASDYLSFCEEKGCEWEGLLNSMPQRFDTAAILTLPSAMVQKGWSQIAAGIEVPLDYDGEIPEGCEIAGLPPVRLLYFQSKPYEKDDEFFDRMETVFDAYSSFDPTAWGYESADDICPRMNFGGEPQKGARLAMPVR